MILEIVVGALVVIGSGMARGFKNGAQHKTDEAIENCYDITKYYLDKEIARDRDLRRRKEDLRRRKEEFNKRQKGEAY